MFKVPNMYVCKCSIDKNKNFKNTSCRKMDCQKLNYPYYSDYQENFYLDKLKEEVFRRYEDKKI